MIAYLQKHKTLKSLFTEMIAKIAKPFLPFYFRFDLAFVFFIFLSLFSLVTTFMFPFLKNHQR